jgi:hypothetical protein
MARTENTCEVCGGPCAHRSQRCARCYRQSIALRFGSASSRLWALVDKHGPVPAHVPELGPCWTWTASCLKSGYGQMSIAGRKTMTHRLSWELAHGAIPPGLQVLHRCDNRRCVRPDHLFLGTDLDNRRDAMLKNRHNSGERHGHAKLTWAIVGDMRARHAAGQGNVDIGRLYGVDKKRVWAITSNKAWLVYEDRVNAARTLLGEGYQLLRAAD